MNKNIGKLARLGLAVGVVNLLERRREGQIRKLFRRLRRRQSFTARTSEQLSMLVRRSGKGMRRQARTFPRMIQRFGRRAPVRHGLGNFSLMAGLALPTLSALSLPALSLRNFPGISGRRESLMARQDGRMAPRVRVAEVASMARNHRWLTLLGLGALLGLAGMFVFGRQIRSRSGMATMPAWPDENQYPRYRPASVAPATGMPATSGSERLGQQRPAAGKDEWTRFCRDFSRPNRDRPVNVEVQAAGGATRALAHEAQLLGIDLGPEGVQIMLGENMDSRMEHDIADPVAVHPLEDESGAQVGLVIHSGDGSTTTVRLA